MPGEFQQIDNAQAEIKKFNEATDAPDLQKAVAKYQATFFGEVSHVSAEIKKTEDKLTSPEAKALLRETGTVKIVELLTKIAQNGAEIKKNKNTNVIAFEQLAQELQGFLNEEKAELPNFIAIDKVEKENDQLEAQPPTNDPEKLIQTKKDFLAKLPASTKASSPYKEKIADKIKDSIVDLEVMKADQILIKMFVKNVDNYAKLNKAYELKPSAEIFVKLQEFQQSLVAKKLGDEIFNGKIDGKNPFIAKLYQHLWEEQFKPAEAIADNLNAAFEAKEKLLYTLQAEQMLSDIEASQQSILRPKWETYYAQLVGNQLTADKPAAQTPEQKAEMAQLEEGLLSAFLILKTTTNRFDAIKDRLDSNTKQKLTHTIEDNNNKIHRIEMRRLNEKNQDSFQNMEIKNYIVLLNMEENGKNYRFNDAYQQLSPEKQEQVRIAVEFIMGKNHKEVLGRTADEKLKLAKSTGNFDYIGQMLGERSKDYVDALKFLKDGKHSEAIVCYQAYVVLLGSMPAEDLTPEEKNALQDAQEKVKILNQSEDYFEALNKLKGNDEDGAYLLLQNYIKQIKSLTQEEQQLHSEQVNGAMDTLKFISQKKVGKINDLLQDVQELKRAQIVDQLDHGQAKTEVQIDGPEIILIQEAIANLRGRIEKGEILDFNAEFQEIKNKITTFNEQNGAKAEDNVMAKFASLYEDLNSADPVTKKQATLQFAQELRDAKSYKLARKYLDKVLEKDPEYVSTAATISKEAIMRAMLDDPEAMKSIHLQAQENYARLKQERPGIELVMTEQQAENDFLHGVLEQKYSREVREAMTKNHVKNEALDLYNDWSPYKKADHFWQEGHFDAETYDDFKHEAAEFTAMTLATLPVGFLAGKAFTASAGLILRATAGGAAREAAMSAFARGGLAALKPGTAAFEALEPAVQQVIIHNQPRLFAVGMAAFGGGVAVEAGTMALGNNFAEGLLAGHGNKITGASLAENLIQVSIFKGIGKLGLKTFGETLQKGTGLKKAAAFAGMEAFSGIGGLGVAAASLYASGHSDQIDTAFVLKNLLQSAMSSAGMHLGEGVVGFAKPGRLHSKADRAVEAAYNEEKVLANQAQQRALKIELLNTEHQLQQIIGKGEKTSLPENNPETGKPWTEIEKISYLKAKITERTQEILLNTNNPEIHKKVLELAKFVQSKDFDPETGVTSPNHVEFEGLGSFEIIGVIQPDQLPADWTSQVIGDKKFSTDRNFVIAVKDSRGQLKYKIITAKDISNPFTTGPLFQNHEDALNIWREIRTGLKDQEYYLSNIDQPYLKVSEDYNFITKRLDNIREGFKNRAAMSPEEKTAWRQEIQDVKELIAERQTGVATIIKTLEHTIRKQLNGDYQLMTEESIFADLDIDAMAKIFSKSEVARIKIAAKELMDRGKKIRKYSEKYRDNPKELFHLLFGVYPQGKVKLIQRDFAIGFECLQKGDYAIAAVNANSAGISLGPESTPIKDLKGNIILANNEAVNNDPATVMNIAIHEEKHAINKTIFHALGTSTHAQYELYGPGLTDGMKPADVLAKYLLQTLTNAKDEILAYMTDRSSKESIITRLATKKGGYNYWDFIRTNEVHLLNAANAQEFSPNAHIQPQLEIEFGGLLPEYEARHFAIVSAAIEAAFIIKDTALLAATSVTEWPILAARMKNNNAEPRNSRPMAPEAIKAGQERSPQNIKTSEQAYIEQRLATDPTATKESVKAELEQEIAVLKPSLAVSLNTNINDVLSILQDGKVKTAFDLTPEEAKARRSALGDHEGYMHRRQQVEGALGWKENEHPYSLAVDDASNNSSNGSANFWGSIRLIFDYNAVKDRSTFTESDSMNSGGLPSQIYQSKNRGNRAESAKQRQLDQVDVARAKAIFNLSKQKGITSFKPELNYIEAQVGGELKIDALKGIQVSRKKLHEEIKDHYSREIRKKAAENLGDDILDRDKYDKEENRLADEKVEEMLSQLKGKCVENKINLVISD